jgi:hypothetical protein
LKIENNVNDSKNYDWKEIKREIKENKRNKTESHEIVNIWNRNFKRNHNDKENEFEKDLTNIRTKLFGIKAKEKDWSEKPQRCLCKKEKNK